MAKYSKKFETWGGRELKAIINGKLTGVKHDKGANTFYVRIPQLTGRAVKKNLGRNKGKAAGIWWDIVEDNLNEQLHQLPRGAVQTKKQLPIIHRLRDDVECEEEYQARKDYLLNEYLDGGLLQKKGETNNEYNRRVLSNPDIPFRIEHSIPEQVLADIFNKWLEDPYECSRRLGREDIASLSKLQVAEPIPLRNMGQFYYDYIPTNRPQASKKERTSIRSWWEEFCGIVNKTYLNDLVKDDIFNYTQTIRKIATKDNRSNVYVKKRYDAVRNVVNTYSKCLEEKSIINNVVGWLKDFPAPQKSNGKVFNPTLLNKKQIKELLEVVKDDVKWKAALLFALNTCSYAVDCRDAKLEHIDLENKILTMWRKKKTVPKCSILWSETVEAIQVYLDSRNSNSPFLFISQQRNRMSESAFTKGVREHIKQNLSFEFNFNMLRDSGRYAAECGNATSNHIKIAMGHRIIGEDDAYLFRHPELVQDVSDAIYKYYML